MLTSPIVSGCAPDHTHTPSEINFQPDSVTKPITHTNRNKYPNDERFIFFIFSAIGHFSCRLECIFDHDLVSFRRIYEAIIFMWH